MIYEFNSTNEFPIVLCSILTAFAEQIKVPRIILIEDGSATVEIALNNEHHNLVAFQMDLILPEGIGIDKTGCRLSSRITDMEQDLVIGKLESGGFRLTSTSMTLTPISGTEGALLILKLYLEENFVIGEAVIGNIYFATSESERVMIDNVSFLIDTTDSADGVRSVENNKQIKDHEFYQLNGVKGKKPQRGINIIRTSDGKTRKVAIK